MRAWVIRAPGGLDQLQQSDVPDPPGPNGLGPRQVRVSPRAAALNHLDLFVVSGLPHQYHFPHIVGADGAGIVDAVGSEVRSVRPGDRVMINPGIPDYTCEYCRAGEQALCRSYGILGEHFPGTLAQYVVVPEQNVAPIPTLATPLSWAEAAAFSLVTLTAWRMVVTRARVQAGGTGLVWGVGGGGGAPGGGDRRRCVARGDADREAQGRTRDRHFVLRRKARAREAARRGRDAQSPNTESLSRGPHAHRQARRGRRDRKRRGSDVGRVVAIAAASRAAGDLRRDDGSEGGARPAPALLVPMEHHGLD